MEIWTCIIKVVGRLTSVFVNNRDGKRTEPEPNEPNENLTYDRTEPNPNFETAGYEPNRRNCPYPNLTEYRFFFSSANFAICTSLQSLQYITSLTNTETEMVFVNIGDMTMALIARKLSAIPATSTASERVFSVCGVTMSDRRARLNPQTLEMLIFLKYNMQPCSDY